MLTATQEQWLQALESGNYNQGTGALHYGGAYCCLGVFCDLQTDLVKRISGFVHEGVLVTGLLENGLAARLGLNGCDGNFTKSIVIDGKEYNSLIGLNDCGLFSFKQIATIVRANLDKVFKNAAESADSPGCTSSVTGS